MIFEQVGAVGDAAITIFLGLIMMLLGFLPDRSEPWAYESPSLTKSKWWVRFGGPALVLLGLGLMGQALLRSWPVQPGESTTPPAGSGAGPRADQAGPAKAGRTRIQGGGADPEFRDPAPDGGLLTGLEVGLGKFVGADVVKAVRPIYLVGDKEVLGQQQGAGTGKVVRIVAKPGYAVGAITVKTGLLIDGLSVTFMKVAPGRLDPRDAYESAWVGGKGGGQAMRLGGDGVPAVGLLGRANTQQEVTGLGLLQPPAKGDAGAKQ